MVFKGKKDGTIQLSMQERLLAYQQTHALSWHRAGIILHPLLLWGMVMHLNSSQWNVNRSNWQVVTRTGPKPPTYNPLLSGCWNEANPKSNFEHPMLKKAE